MNTTYKQQINVLQSILCELPVNSERFKAVNDAAGTIYAKSIEEQLKVNDPSMKLIETAIAHLEERLKGHPVRIQYTLETLYKLRTTINKESRATRRENVYMVLLWVLACLGCVQLVELAVSFWKSL